MPPITPALSVNNPTELPQALLLQDASLLLENDYLPLEEGYVVAPDGMHHVAASTYMRMPQLVLLRVVDVAEPPVNHFARAAARERTSHRTLVGHLPPN
jgi:hypothetical protein